jgi:hypothetical protein
LIAAKKQKESLRLQEDNKRKSVLKHILLLAVKKGNRNLTIQVNSNNPISSNTTKLKTRRRRNGGG